MYDVTNSSWIDLTAPDFGILPSPRNAHGFAALDGKLYVIGGGSEMDCIFQYCHGLSFIELSFMN